MRIIEIEALSNGAHCSVDNPNLTVVPDGCAVIPDDMPIPSTFPFVNITMQDGVVTSMTANQEAYNAAMAEQEPEVEPEPSQFDILEAQVTYTAMMTDTLLGV